MTVFRRPSSGVPAGDAIPFRHDGTIHLFFLSSPADTTDYPERVRTTWQHARTTDLVTWQELPPALEPGEAGEVDADGVWTGSVVERDGVFHIFYTGHRVGARNPQTICHATSTDLVRFTKDERNPILLPPPDCEPIDWRDPYVFWNEGEGRYWMVIAARLASGPRWRRGCLILATSTALTDWVVEREPLYVPGTTYCPECPELWPLGSRWYLVFSRFSEQAGTVVRVADSPRGPFRIPTEEDLGGRRWYAAKSAPSPDALTRVFFGWVHEQSPDGRWCWGGDFAAAREVRADETGLVVRLPDAIRASYRRPVAINSSQNVVLDLRGVGGWDHHPLSLEAVPASYLARCAFSLVGPPAAFGLSVRTNGELSGFFLTFDRQRGSLHLSRAPQPLDDFWADLVGRGQERREVDGPVLAEVRLPGLASTTSVECLLLVEGDLLEVYVEDRIALTHRISPPIGTELGAFVVDGDARFSASLRRAG